MKKKRTLRGELADLQAKWPFEPFRIKLVNGDFHDVGHPLSMAILSVGVFIASQDGHWAIFTINRISAIESLLPFENLPGDE